MSNYYQPPSYEPEITLEETPVAGENQPSSGHFSSCYICGFDLRQPQTSGYAVRRTYGLQRLTGTYVITVCVWCNHRFFR